MVLKRQVLANRLKFPISGVSLMIFFSLSLNLLSITEGLLLVDLTSIEFTDLMSLLTSIPLLMDASSSKTEDISAFKKSNFTKNVIKYLIIEFKLKITYI